MGSGVTLALLLTATPTVEQLRREVAELKYSEATKTIAALEATDGLLLPDVVQLYLHAGLVRAALKDEAGAREAFTRALLLDPKLELPGKPSPRVTTPFAAAKAWAQAHPLGVALTVSRAEGIAWSGTLTPSADEKRLAESLEVLIEEDGVTRQLRGPLSSPPRLEGKGGRVRVSWWLMSPRRWVLAKGVQDAPFVDVPPARPLEVRLQPKAAVKPGSFPRAMGWILVAASVPLGLLGGINFSVAQTRALEATNAMTWDDLQAALTRGRNAQTEGAVFIAVAAASLLGGGALVVFSSLPSSPESPKVGFAPVEGGALFTLGGHW